jgi:DNA-binding XRE family transcriptional regulator
MQMWNGKTYIHSETLKRTGTAHSIFSFHLAEKKRINPENARILYGGVAILFLRGFNNSESREITENQESYFKRDSELQYEPAGNNAKPEQDLSVVMTDIAAALINYRVDNNLSQKDLAGLLGCSQTMISKIEKGDYDFTIGKLFDFVGRLNGSVSIRIDFPNDAPEQMMFTIWDL